MPGISGQPTPTGSGGGITALTGDVTASGSGSQAATIPTSVISTFMRTVADDADAATARTTLGAIGGSVGATSTAIPVASGTGGATLAASTVLIFNNNQMSGQLLRPRTTGTTLATTDSGRLMTIPSGGGADAYTLPASPTAGTVFEFAVIGSDQLTIQAQGSQVIYIGGSASTAGGSAASSTQGSYLRIVYVATNQWHCLAAGTWTLA
jgi:hypothetical protein